MSFIKGIASKINYVFLVPVNQELDLKKVQQFELNDITINQKFL